MEVKASRRLWNIWDRMIEKNHGGLPVVTKCDERHHLFLSHQVSATAKTSVIETHLLVINISQVILQCHDRLHVVWSGRTNDLDESRRSWTNVALPFRVAGTDVHSIRETETFILILDDCSVHLDSRGTSEDGHDDGTKKDVRDYTCRKKPWDLRLGRRGTSRR